MNFTQGHRLKCLQLWIISVKALSLEGGRSWHKWAARVGQVDQVPTASHNVWKTALKILNGLILLKNTLRETFVKYFWTCHGCNYTLIWYDAGWLCFIASSYQYFGNNHIQFSLFVLLYINLFQPLLVLSIKLLPCHYRNDFITVVFLQSTSVWSLNGDYGTKTNYVRACLIMYEL